MPRDDVEPFVSAAAIARLLGVSQRWVRKQAEAGAMPAYKVAGTTWRFRVSEVLAWVERVGPDLNDDQP